MRRLTSSQGKRDGQDKPETGGHERNDGQSLAAGQGRVRLRIARACLALSHFVQELVFLHRWMGEDDNVDDTMTMVMMVTETIMLIE